MSSYELYRKSTLGKALEETLKDFEEDQLIPKSLANKMLDQFDKIMNKKLSQLPKQHLFLCDAKLSTYRYCDNVWTFLLRDVTVRDCYNSFPEPIDILKIVACDGRETNVQKMIKHGPSKRAAGASQVGDVDKN